MVFEQNTQFQTGKIGSRGWILPKFSGFYYLVADSSKDFEFEVEVDLVVTSLAVPPWEYHRPVSDQL
jgi:hypothetical protein